MNYHGDFSVSPPLREHRDYLRMADIVSCLVEVGRLECPANITIAKPAQHPLEFRISTTSSCPNPGRIGKLELLKNSSCITYQIFEDQAGLLDFSPLGEDPSGLIRQPSSVEVVIEPHSRATIMDRVAWGGAFLYQAITGSELKPFFVQAKMFEYPVHDTPLRMRMVNSLGTKLLTFDVFADYQRCMNVSAMTRIFV